MSTLAKKKLMETADVVRKVLKQEFPDVKFSVRTRISVRGQGISRTEVREVNISWKNGPDEKDVNPKVQRFAKSIWDSLGDHVFEREGREYIGADAIYAFKDRS